MKPYLKRVIPQDFAVLSGTYPPDELCFRSDHLQILCNSSDTPWIDPSPHQHLESDEAYIVLKGMITLDVEGELVTVPAGEICFVPSGVNHAVVAVETPYRGFVVRAPALQDKVYQET